MRTITTEEFIKRANFIHLSKYGYSKVVYLGMHFKILIDCPHHGEFLQSPANHLQGQSCPTCAIVNRQKAQTYTIDNFICEANKIHNNKYSYDQSVYNNSHSKIKIFCPEKDHGFFWQLPTNHISGHGCLKCGGSEKLSTATFIRMANQKHNYKFDYNNVTYTNTKTKISIRCSVHGNFLQTPNDHLSGYGCPKCKMSHGESIIEQFLIKTDTNYKSQVKFLDCKNKRCLPFDFGIYKNDLLFGLIEYQGRQHYIPISWSRKTNSSGTQFKQLQKRDKIKKDYCEQNHIMLLEIPYWDFNMIPKILTKFLTQKI